MTDIFDKKKRSEIMSKISGKNTKPELIIRKALFAEGYRYRLHRKDLPGNPDMVFPSKKKVIFINGCFWHGHNCKKAALPTTHREFWEKKLSGNKERDKRNLVKLKAMGWKNLVIWQCQIKKSTLETQIDKIKAFLENE
ncbi:MAG: DNA mismatch endonuclease Vsr [Planctomycetaceae bacterium]|nr:MAG: DNA mismatch endonuclease Vsr [Planctomycetaceae bacterium]